MEHDIEDQNPEDVQLTEVSGGKNSYLVPAAIVLAGVIVAGAVVYGSGSRPQARLSHPAMGSDQTAAVAPTLTEALKIGNRDTVLGNPNAPVTFIEYGDYQCPFCGRVFTQVEPQLRDEYIKTGKVKMVYRNFQFLGSESTDAGAAAECAKDQNKFWPYHDELYKAEVADGHENSGNLNRALFISLAQKVGLDAPSFTSCYDGGKYVEQVKKDTAAAGQLGVNSTPTNYINGQEVKGAQPYSAFKAVIDAALAAK